MSLRDFICERLTAAATEIFGAIEQTVIKYEEVIDRQRRLLDVILKPEIKLHRAVLPQQHYNEEDGAQNELKINLNPEIKTHRCELTKQHQCKEEEVLENQPCNQHGESIQDQEEPEPPQIKGELNGVCSSEEGGEPELSQKTDLSGVTVRPDESDDEQELSYGCKTCGESFESWSLLILHQRTHTVKWPHLSNTPVKSIDQPTEVRTSREKSLSCRICGKSCKSRDAFIRHMRTHADKLPFSCKICGNRYSLKTNLIRHVKFHTAERSFICTTCGKAFIQKSDLIRHIRVHTGERPYTCNVCYKTFKRRNHLKIHLRSHQATNSARKGAVHAAPSQSHRRLKD